MKALAIVLLLTAAGVRAEPISPRTAGSVSLASTLVPVAGGIVLIAAQSNSLGVVLAGSGLIVGGLVIGPSVGRLAAGNLGGGDRVLLRAGILLIGTVVTLGVVASIDKVANPPSDFVNQSALSAERQALFGLGGATLVVVLINGLLDIGSTSRDVEAARVSMLPIFGPDRRGVTLALRY